MRQKHLHKYKQQLEKVEIYFFKSNDAFNGALTTKNGQL